MSVYMYMRHVRAQDVPQNRSMLEGALNGRQNWRNLRV